MHATNVQMTCTPKSLRHLPSRSLQPVPHSAQVNPAVLMGVGDGVVQDVEMGIRVTTHQDNANGKHLLQTARKTVSSEVSVVGAR